MSAGEVLGSRFYDENGLPLGNDVLEWARRYENRERWVVEQTVVDTFAAALLVSTVALGLDHNFGRGAPLTFETMVFRMDVAGSARGDDLFVDRYATRAGAEEAHRRLVGELRRRWWLRSFLWRRVLARHDQVWGGDWRPPGSELVALLPGSERPALPPGPSDSLAS